MDGKHIVITKPYNSGSLYYNYKGFYSSVLLALVNAKKEFIMVDAGMNGRISDGGVMFYSKFGEIFQEGKLNIPPPAPMPNTADIFPFVVVENAFMILSSRFGVLQKPIHLQPPTATIVTRACCYLHNFLPKESKMYLNSNDGGREGENLTAIQSTFQRNSTTGAKMLRDSFCHYYYNNEGNQN